MIIGIGGYDRCLKTGLGAILCSEPEKFNEYSLTKYNIKRGYGNLHLYNMPFPWYYMTSQQLVRFIREVPRNNIENSIFFIDEADQVYNPRDYASKEQTLNLKCIGQHAKMKNIFIYTYQKGQPDDELKGVDKILRSNTRLDFEMRYYDPEDDYAILHGENRHFYKTIYYDSIIDNVSQYFHLWNTNERVI